MHDHLTLYETATEASASASATEDVQRTVAPQCRDLTQRQEQFSALAATVEGALHSTALRWSGNHTQAEDLVQETLLCAWRNFDRFTVGTRFKAWVFQILRFLAWNRYRSAALRQFATDFQADESLHGTTEQEERRVEPFGTDWESAFPDLVDDTLKHALDCLTPSQRLLALCIPMGGLSYQECADELGIPVGTVMSRYWRARTRLRQELSRNGVDGVHCRNAKS